jgi:hypothetical protein
MLRLLGIGLLFSALFFGLFGAIGLGNPDTESSTSYGMVAWMFISAGICAVAGVLMILRLRITRDDPLVKHEHTTIGQAPDKPASEGA